MDKKNLAFDRVNFILLGIGMAVVIIGFILIIIAKILMFCKWLKLFFSNLYGLLYLIVYFCALEILPCFLLVQGLLQTNIILQLKL